MRCQYLYRAYGSVRIYSACAGILDSLVSERHPILHRIVGQANNCPVHKKFKEDLYFRRS